MILFSKDSNVPAWREWSGKLHLIENYGLKDIFPQKLA
jgi:hypothetical protein